VTGITAAQAGTIRRIIYNFHVIGTAPDDNVVISGAVGLIVADATAVAAGVASISKPITDGDQEWLFTRGYGLQYQLEAAQTAVSFAPQFDAHGDIRTMRKLKQSDIVAVVVENEAGSAISVLVQARVLFSS